ncbi:MAG: 1-deoxy-D-xylulose-5-phosphate reductoisomerase [Cytophagales bacterium]
MLEKGSKQKRGIAILGSTGSIGTQALEVIRENASLFEVEVLTAQNSADLLIKQALEFKPNAVVIENEVHYQKVKEVLFSEGIKVFTGTKALSEVVEMGSIDMVLTALVGYSGLLPTINAIKHKKHIALANKETLVVAGALVTKLADENNVALLPVDSEHSAIFQCLVGEERNQIEKIILTASGGPFRGKKREDLQQITKNQALKHPNWSMGAKITIDSATLMNKGLEVIEAKWLFDLMPNQIDVVVHPQSIIHSLVQFEDGSLKAQMGLPDMKLPIQYAMAFPQRIKNDFPRFSFTEFPNLSFEQPDRETFRCLALAFEAMEKGGNMPCVLNAANEIAVSEFLKNRIGFLDIAEVIEQCLAKSHFIQEPTLDDLVQSNQEIRMMAEKNCKVLK